MVGRRDLNIIWLDIDFLRSRHNAARLTAVKKIAGQVQPDRNFLLEECNTLPGRKQAYCQAGGRPKFTSAAQLPTPVSSLDRPALHHYAIRKGFVKRIEQ